MEDRSIQFLLIMKFGFKCTDFDIALLREQMRSLRMFRWSGIQTNLCLQNHTAGVPSDGIKIIQDPQC